MEPLASISLANIHKLILGERDVKRDEWIKRTRFASCEQAFDAGWDAACGQFATIVEAILKANPND